MEQPETTNRPAPRPSRNLQQEALEQLGGEPLTGSGFEPEQADGRPDERNEDHAR
jgi:hypothetical protein